MMLERRLLPEGLAALDAGVRDLPSVLLEAGLEAGSPLRLLRPDGARVALALFDPENQLVRVVARADEGDDITPELWRARVVRAVAQRRALGLVAPDAAWRALHGAGDSTPGVQADVFGGWAVVYALSEALMPAARAIAEALCAEAGLRGAVLKCRARGAAQAGRVRQEWLGARTPERLVVQERGLSFEVHLDAGINVGLFTDLREPRHGLARFLGAGQVLNLFAYTGSLSVVAARAGATVTSVDLSAGVLGWAQDNFRLNGLEPDRGGFVAEDASRFLNQAIGAGRRFDAVLIDPPTVASGRDAGFALERDYPGFVARAAQLLAPGGLLWLASNARGVSLLGFAREGLRRVGRNASVLETAGLAADYPTLVAQPEDRYLQVVVLRLA